MHESMQTNGGPKVDLYFHVQGDGLPVDHGYALYAAISRVLPADNGGESWIHRSHTVGLIPVRGRYMGKGRLKLGRVARFGLRLAAADIPKVLPLAGQRLEVHGDLLRVGVSTTHALVPSVALYAHLVTTRNGQDETRFDCEAQRQLETLEVQGRMHRGPRRIITIKDKRVVAHSLLVTELTAEESIRLQEHGLGGRRKMGCGVFVPVQRQQGRKDET